jgi:dTDP-4-amino-4,6-dideoxygalactose transaminase
MINKKYIPFNSISIQGDEINNLIKAIDNDHLSGDGPFTKLCSEYLEEELKVNKSLITTSCTHAMEMAALILDIKEGDEILVPSYTFVSSINPFILRGATPKFIDIREDTLNIDESLIKNSLTNKTKAIVPVHYAGVGCEMDTITSLANENNLAIIEDNAHGLFGKYKNKYLGTFGDMATQSFHETKNFTCGEGGALLINTNDNNISNRAEIIREKGTNRSQFFRGDVQKYEWIDIGSSFLPSDLLAAFLYSQLKSKANIQNKRRLLWNKYFALLKDWADINNVKLPYVPDHCEQSYHMFYLIMPSTEIRNNFIDYLLNSNIKSVFHYLPLHSSEMGRKFDRDINLKVTDEISSRLVRMPFYTDLDLDDIDFDIIFNFKF